MPRWKKNWRKFPICRSTTCRTARTSTAMSSITSGARSAIMRSSPSSISNWAKRSGMMDFELAAKLSGARFVVLQKGLARMERALGQFMLDVHTEREAWLYGGQSAAAGARRCDVWHSAIAEISRRSVCSISRTSSTFELLTKICRQIANVSLDVAERFGIASARQIQIADVARLCDADPRSSLAHPHRRSPAHQSRSRIHRRRRHAAAPLHRLHAVLPRRSGRCRQRHARHDPPAPVHQGRTGLDHHAGKIHAKSTSACWPAPRKC